MFRKKELNEVTQAVSLITLADRTSPVSEQYRTIRTNIQFSMIDKELKTLVITSSGPGEGKSTTSANLAVVFANSGVRTLLVDADLRNPTVAKTFALNNQHGLSNLLSERDSSVSDMVQASGIENLTILSSGPKPQNPSEMLGSVRMHKVIQDMRDAYDLVIFDMPPVVAVTDAQVVASQVDGTVMVIREGISNKNALLKAKSLLEMVSANVLGVVYNGSTRNVDQGYYYYGA